MNSYFNKCRARITVIILVLMPALFSSCKKFLDEKTDKQLVVPASLQDAQALLDNYAVMNENYSPLGNVSDDNYFLKETNFNALSQTARFNHTWDKDAVNENEWRKFSSIILNANLALE